MPVNIKSFNRVTTLNSANNVLLSGSQEIKFSGNVTTNVINNRVEVAVGTGSGVTISDNANTYNVNEIKFLGSVNVVDNGGVGEVTILAGSFDTKKDGVSVEAQTTSLNFIGNNISVSSPSANEIDIEVSKPDVSLNGAPIVESNQLNFTGLVSVSDNAGIAEIEILETLSSIRLNATPVISTTDFNFIGQVSVTDNGGVADIEILGSTNTLKQNGSVIASDTNIFNFIGATVTDQGGGEVDITILPNAPSGTINTAAWFRSDGQLVGTTVDETYINFIDAGFNSGGNRKVFLLKQAGSNISNPTINSRMSLMGMVGSNIALGGVHSSIVNINNCSWAGGSSSNSFIGAQSFSINGGSLLNIGVFASNMQIDGGNIDQSVLIGSNGSLDSAGSPNAILRGSFISGLGNGESNTQMFQCLRLLGQAMTFNGNNQFQQSIISINGNATHEDINIRNSIYVFNGNAFTNRDYTILDSIVFTNSDIGDLNISNRSILLGSGNMLGVNNISRAIIAGGFFTLDNVNSSNFISLGTNTFRNISGNTPVFGIGDVELNHTTNPEVISKIGYGNYHMAFESGNVNKEGIKINGNFRFSNGSGNSIDSSSDHVINTITNSSNILNIETNGDLDDGEIKILVKQSGADTTIEHNAGNLLLNGSANATLTVGSTISFVYNATLDKWLETSRSIV